MIPESLHQLPESEYRVPYLKSTDNVFPRRNPYNEADNLLFHPMYFWLWPWMQA